jgi:hypothetical protein
VTRLAWRRAARFFGLFLIIGAALLFWGSAAVGTKVHNLAGDGTVDQKIVGLTLFTAERVGNVTTLRPGLGALVVVILVPLLAATIALTVTAWTTPRP